MYAIPAAVTIRSDLLEFKNQFSIIDQRINFLFGFEPDFYLKDKVRFRRTPDKIRQA